jgi:hypothetical protein
MCLCVLALLMTVVFLVCLCNSLCGREDGHQNIAATPERNLTTIWLNRLQQQQQQQQPAVASSSSR